MANEPMTIQYIDLGDGERHPIDAVTLNNHPASDFQTKDMLVQTLDGADNFHYPSAKCVYDEIGKIETRLSNI